MRNSKENKKVNEYDFEKVAIKVSTVTIFWNTVLAVFKFIAGLLA